MVTGPMTSLQRQMHLEERRYPASSWVSCAMRSATFFTVMLLLRFHWRFNWTAERDLISELATIGFAFPALARPSVKMVVICKRKL